jgi:hypothetical protein
MKHRTVAVLGLAGLTGLAACRSSEKESRQQDPPPAVAIDAGAPDASLDACRAAAAQVATLPRTQRIVALLQGCAPCGDWGPLLAWNIPESSGGPSRELIERGLVACNAFCEPDARQRFFGALDGARGQNSRAPWKLLGEVCKAQVSAVPDTRYMSAPYFALDRVARMIGDAALLAALELPLPAVTITGVGVELPSSPLLAPEAGPTALTVDAGQFLLGSLPVARLSPTGLQISGDYPGAQVAPAALAAALARPEQGGHPVALLAPRRLPVARIIEAVAAAGDREIRLAVGDLELLHWSIPATVPIALRTGPAPRGGMRFTLDETGFEALKAVKAAPREDLLRAPVTIAADPTATATSLANLLGALGYAEVKSVVLVRATARPGARPAAAKP